MLELRCIGPPPPPPPDRAMYGGRKKLLDTSEVPDKVGEALGPAELAAPFLWDVPRARAVKRGLAPRVARVQCVVLLKQGSYKHVCRLKEHVHHV